MTFDPKRFVIKVQGGKEYLPVSARLLWFRSEKPDWGIVTHAHEIDMEKQYAIFGASIFDAEGRLIATATKHENRQGFADFIEKAETGAVGRALGMCGYGTQFCDDFDEGKRADKRDDSLPVSVVDSPQKTNGSDTPTSDDYMRAFARRAYKLGIDLSKPGANGEREMDTRSILWMANEILGRSDCYDMPTDAQWRQATAMLPGYAAGLEAMKQKQQVEIAHSHATAEPAPTAEAEQEETEDADGPPNAAMFEDGEVRDPFAKDAEPKRRDKQEKPTSALAGGL